MKSAVLAALRRAPLALLTPRSPRGPQSAAALTVGFALLALFVCPRWFQRMPFTPDGHAYISLGEALNARYCGKPGQLAPRYNIGAGLSKDPMSVFTPFPELLASRAGSLEAYCGAVDLEFLNNENSMMLLMRAGLRVVPHVSAARLGRWLATLRFVILLIFAFAMLDCGVAIPLALLAYLVACDVSNDLRFLQFSIYSFFIPLLLLMPSLYVLALRHLAPRGAWWRAASLVGAGFLTAFCANMRSSHLPVYVAMFAFYALCARRFSARRGMAYAATAIVCFALAYLAFGRIFIRPLVPQHPSGYFNYSHHVIAHPLVLGLALPPSDLSRREGIQWEDSVGLDLARRMVPNAAYLGPGYEEGLFLYYVRLWLMYPDEMRAIYRAKLDLAGTGMFEKDPRNARQRVIGFITSVGRARSGAALLAIGCVALAGAAVLYAWRRLLPAFLLVLLSLSGVFLLLESAIIIPTFYLQYHGYLVVYAAILIGVAGQLVIDAVGAAVQRLFARPRRAATA